MYRRSPRTAHLPRHSLFAWYAPTSFEPDSFLNILFSYNIRRLVTRTTFLPLLLVPYRLFRSTILARFDLCAAFTTYIDCTVCDGWFSIFFSRIRRHQPRREYRHTSATFRAAAGCCYVRCTYLQWRWACALSPLCPRGATNTPTTRHRRCCTPQRLLFLARHIAALQSPVLLAAARASSLALALCCASRVRLLDLTSFCHMLPRVARRSRTRLRTCAAYGFAADRGNNSGQHVASSHAPLFSSIGAHFLRSARHRHAIPPPFACNPRFAYRAVSTLHTISS